MARERITSLMMSERDVAIAMSGGNPGALVTCLELMRHGRAIDPDHALGGGAGAILALDTLNIWDDRIYMLFSDVCGRSLAKMAAVLRAYQLGQLGGATAEAIHHAVDNRGDGLDVNAVVVAVKKRLPNFRTDYIPS